MSLSGLFDRSVFNNDDLLRSNLKLSRFNDLKFLNETSEYCNDQPNSKHS